MMVAKELTTMTRSINSGTPSVVPGKFEVNALSSNSSVNSYVSVEKPVELRKQINLLNCVSIIIGIVIGSGIFVSPVGILANVKSVGMSCVMWAVCGLHSTLCALCFVELGVTLPQSGGEYLYIKRAFGDFPAFLCLWINFLILFPVSQAALCLIFATYVLRPIFPHCQAPAAAVKLIAALITGFLTMINCTKVKWATKVQFLFTASKLLALIIIIIIGFSRIIKGEVSNFNDSFAGSEYSAGAIAIAFYSGFWAFGGWNSLNFLAAEVVNPQRNLPLAIIISMTAVTLVYVTANIAYFAVLTPLEVLESSAVAVTFSERTIVQLSYIMPIFIAISVAGSINGTLMAGSRLFYIGARNHHLPVVLSMITIKNLTPAPSLLSVFMLTLAMTSYGDIFYLIEMIGFGASVVFTTVLAGLVWLRIREPHLQRPIKLPLVLPIFLGLVGVAIITLTIYQQPYDSVTCLIFMAAGAPFYLLGVIWKKPASIQGRTDAATVFLQKLLLIIPEETVANS